MRAAGSKTVINVRDLLCFCFLLSSLGISISSANILTDVPKSNPLGIDWYPAPSPEDGPPLSAGASRDPSLLPAQIGAIVGAYLFSVCVIGTALIIIGRRLRHGVQRSAKALDIEMVVSRFDPSPITPGTARGARNFSWPSPEKTDRNPYIFPPSVPAAQSFPAGGDGDPYVDHRIIEADREMLQRDLEDLYAHVMEQEDAKAAGISPKEMPLPPQLQSAGPVPQSSPQRQPSPPKKLGKIKPAKLDIDDSLKSPKQNSRTSRSSSILSSLKSPRRKGIREMRISSPIQTPMSSAFPPSVASDEEPLSPRYYAPPAPPPVPTDQIPYTHTRNASSGSNISPVRSTGEKLFPENHHYDNRSITQFHRPNQSQISVQSYNSPRSSKGDPLSASSATSQTPLYPTTYPKNNNHAQLQPPRIKTSQGNLTGSNPPSNNSSTRALPFRQFEPALASPSFQQTTKTTVLERKSPLSPGLNTAGQPRTPWSAGAVPYSPYQPFTPMLPITPRLVTREERKVKKKSEGRAPVLEMIKSDDELFDSAY